MIHRGHRPTALPYGMICTKIFQHFEVSFRDEVILNPKSTDTINIITLKRMRIFKEDGQWVAKTKEFDDESGPFTLPFEGHEEIDADEDNPPPRPRLQMPSSSTFGFTFTENHYNLFNGRIDSLISTVENLQQSVDVMTSLLQALHSRLDVVLLLYPPPEH
ncbi:Uncharacterized protein Adt_14466 [Abeliophyllum distichum]|uniref:Uncharacterized protein n=1 Tax=Abeliophyllum distichum TaxID=126358 RepID=A0ABD1TZQ1_9LAMI